MNMDDLRRLLTGRVLFSLDTIITPRLVPLFYVLGLAGIGLWAIAHFVHAFSSNLGNGLWGLIEIAVFAPLAIVGLRMACEAVLVYFRAHADIAPSAVRPKSTANLLDEVSAAIRDLADEDEDDYFAPATEPPRASHMPGEPPLPHRPGIRRTARRTPPPPPEA